MPLNDNAINDILPFAAEALEESGDLMPLTEYLSHAMRARGHQPGIALRELQNRVCRQTSHVAAGVAQFIANRYGPGVRDDADLDKVEDGLALAIQEMIEAAISRIEIPEPVRPYELAEIYYFRHPTLRPGFQPAQGGLIANAATLYPEVWAYLQTTEGQKLCKTEAEWQALTKAVWATLADGSTVGWNGIGGAPWYVQDLNAGTLRTPDLRGMYVEAAGYDGLGVGGTHGDAVRNIVGQISDLYGVAQHYSSGPFSALTPRAAAIKGTDLANAAWNVEFDVSRVVPTGNKVAPRAWGALACVYLGQPS